jgi:hypothetical protein
MSLLADFYSSEKADSPAACVKVSVRAVKNQKTMTCCFDRAKALEQGMPQRHRVKDLSRHIPFPKGNGAADTAHVSVPIANVSSFTAKSAVGACDDLKDGFAHL